ncbi:eukaryotic translation initiation factor 2-alpha kinase [Anthonomus grandis grandis]|uniref:eukaryotic translation initiation factor 2-alpha kinase n=1 Tax=Anthonomus grandis grandis TaxID=2921223 RepID=UPI002165312F|nr:eukaryotic translation initiation factor 2-alpha kinase [Anthonomus grandis grandis]
MWPKIAIGVVAFKILCSVVNASNLNSESVKSLPYCPTRNASGAVLVSTLDGKLSALNSTGHLLWEVETGPGPLLVSNIHQLELTNNGEWIRIIPSLTGTLYKFDGNTIDPISISAETLLRSSFKYSDDLVIAGGLEIRTYGVGFRSGKLIYECTQSKCANHEKEEMDDILVLERSTQVIRAVEPRTGHERWNFSVGLHNIKLPQASCLDDSKMFDANISAIIPKGLLLVSSIKNNIEEYNWQYKFHSPIVKVWKWDGMKLGEINLFDSKSPELVTSGGILPSIYIGMHKKQLYIHESNHMQALLLERQYAELTPAESNSLAKIPWKPISASTESTEDDVTALSVLNNSEYVNGNGYYLYTEHAIDAKNTAHCEKNDTLFENVTEEVEAEIAEAVNYLSIVQRFYKEALLCMGTFAISVYFIIKNKLVAPIKDASKEIIIVEKPVAAEISRPERQLSENGSEGGFNSRFENDFSLINCLGRGGFGVVFQVRQKLDDGDYAIKRITLPNEESSRDRVMREVKALAKLDHKNIIRYCCCWVEHPPVGWDMKDAKFMEPSFSSHITQTETTSHHLLKRQKSVSVSIDIPHTKFEDSVDDSHIVFEDPDNNKDDSFIVFQDDDASTTNNITSVTTNTLHTVENSQSNTNVSEHMKKKINWKRPGRKHHSWDLTQNSTGMVFAREPPMYLYIQMQLCRKETLKDWLSLNMERKYTDMLMFFSQILDAVEYVHQRKLIHRDLKPSNIFFSQDGQIKVGDFGLVKDLENCFDLEIARSTPSSHRGHTKEVGTTLYMSPEQSKGKSYDSKVDIFALGIILFELLVPFSTNMERIKTLTDVKTKKFPDGFSDKYPDEYLLLEHMLDENPNKRPSTNQIRDKKPFYQNNNVEITRGS